MHCNLGSPINSSYLLENDYVNKIRMTITVAVFMTNIQMTAASTPLLSTDQIMIKLGLEPLYYRRRAHILRFVDECIANRVPRYLSNYFNVRNCDIHRHKTRNNNDLILERINLECTKRAFFYKGAKIFNNF